MKKLKSEFIFEDNEIKVLLEIDYENNKYSIYPYANNRKSASFTFKEQFGILGVANIISVTYQIQEAASFASKELGILNK